MRLYVIALGILAFALAAWWVDVVIRRRRLAAGKTEMREHLNNWRNIQ